MRLGELIIQLKGVDPDTPVRLGFSSPHSYRGYYNQVAFAPKLNTTAGEMLKCAEDALGSTYSGYKGGEYEMGEWTAAWLANHGECGEQIGPTLLDYMCGRYP